MPPPSRPITRRGLLRAALHASILSACAGTSAAAYSVVGWRWGAHVERPLIRIPSLPAELDGLTIALLSDIHHSEAVSLPYVESVVATTNALKPDLVLLGGDYVSDDASFAGPAAQVLGQLQAPLGRFATLGNHDHWTDPERVTAALADAGFAMLRNAGLQLRPGLWLLGVDDVWEAQDDLPGTLARLAPPPEATTLLLAHEPDFADRAREFPIDLQLSGHSHGGQVRLPLVGAPVLPWLGQRYPMGLARLDRLQVYTTRGVGVLSSLPIRFNCPPEITLLTLRTG